MTLPLHPKRICFFSPGYSELTGDIWHGCLSVFRHIPGVRVINIGLNQKDVETVRAWGPDVVIAHSAKLESEDLLESLAVPVLNTSGVLHKPRFPTVTLDNVETGRLAAAHLLEKQYKCFAYLGALSTGYSKERLRGFTEKVEAAGAGPVAVWSQSIPSIALADPADHLPLAGRLLSWVKSHPPGVGIFCPDDHVAQSFLDLLALVEEDPLSLMGLVSGHHGRAPTVPGVSGVRQPGQAWGREAARAALRLLQGETLPPFIRVSPLGVFTQETTAGPNANDREVRSVIRFIHREIKTGINVQDVVQNGTRLHRRALERRFKQEVGHSVLQEIQNARLQRACFLLLENPHQPLVEIAAQSGFTDTKHMNRVFSQRLGLTPTTYRERSRNV